MMASVRATCRIRDKIQFPTAVANWVDLRKVGRKKYLNHSTYASLKSGLKNTCTFKIHTYLNHNLNVSKLTLKGKTFSMSKDK